LHLPEHRLTYGIGVSQEGSKNRNWKGGRTLPIIRNCKQCGNPFTTNLINDGKFCNRRCAAIWGVSHSKKRDTRPELAVKNWLQEKGISFQSQVPFSKIGVVDFLVGTTVIECDGVYWHTLPGTPEKETKRDAKLNALGYTVIRISDEEMKKASLDKIIGIKSIIATMHNREHVGWLPEAFYA
jgi:very-short-patch-repair endonuclease